MIRFFKQSTKRISGVILCLLMAVFVFLSSAVTSHAEVTEESIKAKENQISEAKKERDSLKNAKTDLEKVKKELETSKSNLNSYITQLDGQLSDIQSKIDALSYEITEKEQQIETTTAELLEAEEIQKAQYEAMKKRIKFMYERGDTLYLGDHRNNSNDSRALGSISRNMIVGHVRHVLYPFDSWRGVE